MKVTTNLRKLESSEVAWSQMESVSNTIRTLRLRTGHLDLFARLDRLKSAIHTWKRSQPFLRANVAHLDDDYYYVIDEDSSANRNLENVHFLRVESRVDDELNRVLVDEGLIVELAVEKCANELININKNPELLWQMLIIEMNRNEEGEFVYEFVWHVSHIIADGISMSKNFTLLLDVIYRTITSDVPVELPDYGVYAGTEKIFAKEFSMKPAPPVNNQPPRFVLPEFLDRDRARKNSQTIYDKYFEGKQLDFELIDLNTNESYVTLTELIRISKEVSLKRKKFDVPGETLAKFYKKCKSEEAKLTSALNVLAAVSLFRLYANHSLKLPESANLIPISIRPLRPDTEIGSFQLGNCVGGLITTIPNELTDPNDPHELASKFWLQARQQTDSFDTRVKTDYGKFFKPELPNPDAPPKPNYFIHLSVSNIGVLDTAKYECFTSGAFKLDNMYTSCLYDRSMDSLITGTFFTTVGDKLCCSLANNSFYFDPIVADEFSQLFQETLNFIIQ